MSSTYDPFFDLIYVCYGEYLEKKGFHINEYRGSIPCARKVIRSDLYDKTDIYGKEIKCKKAILILFFYPLISRYDVNLIRMQIGVIVDYIDFDNIINAFDKSTYLPEFYNFEEAENYLNHVINFSDDHDHFFPLSEEEKAEDLTFCIENMSLT